MTPSLLIVPDRYKASKLYSQIPDNGAGDFTVVRNTTATRVDALGLIESVAANVPRLDYTGGGCPGLLVEPAATNLLLRSEEFNVSPWANRALPIITANNAIAPNGTMSADSFNVSDSGLSGRIQVVALGAGTYTFSCYIKRNASSVVGAAMRLRVIADGSTIQQVIAPTNDWVRYSLTFTAAVGVTLAEVLNSNINHFDAWGAQLETGSVATSYIPTVASTVTRNADVISRSSVSGLIGQTAGTLYAEINLSKLTGSRYIIAILVNSTNYFAIRTNASNAFIFRYRNGGSETTIPSIPNVSNSSTGIFKLALAYQDGNYAAAVNGTVYPSTASGIFPSGTFETVDLSFTTPLNDRISAAAIYTTRLDNATLSQLTML
jgi:hypothetical protein